MTAPNASNDRPPSARTEIRHHRERARYDRATVDAVLRQGLICHVAFVEGGRPFVVPTTYAPFDGGIVLHGAIAGRMIGVLASGAQVSIGVTLLDGLVLARSAMHHSMNFRSVVLFGTGVAIVEKPRKRAALAALVEHVVPGRGPFVRLPTDAELDRTGVVWFPVDEASAKVRTGPPLDAVADRELREWSGTLPLRAAAGPPECDPANTFGLGVPEHVATWSRGGTHG
jgi:nitroimidazol reductase NimA-like FMN-containing flavoprotein (pyridoxamine 5'-phosphate oxidase superfamily)